MTALEMMVELKSCAGAICWAQECELERLQ